MSALLYKYIDTICILLGIAIAYIPIFHEVKTKPRLHNTLPKNEAHRIWRMIPRPTISGWIFLACVVALFFFSYKKADKDEIEKEAFQCQIKNGQRKVEIADSLYKVELANFATNLTRSDTLHTRLMTDYINQLDKWGLKLQDSMIVRKGAQLPFLNAPPKDVVDGVTIKTDLDTLSTDLVIYNSGDGPATDVHFVVYLLLERNRKYYKTKVVFEQVGNISIPSKHTYTLHHQDLLSRFSPYKTGYNKYYIFRGYYYDALHKIKQPFKLDYVYYNSSVGTGFSIYSEGEDLYKKLSNAEYLR